MINELCKRDEDWRKMAFQISKCHSISDDMVQEMYLKFANYDKQLNDCYIFFALRSIYIDMIRANKKEYLLSEFNFNITEDAYDYDKDKENENNLNIILTELERLPYFEREVFKITRDLSLRKLSAQSGIHFMTIAKSVTKTKQKIKQKWEEQKKSKDLEM